MTLIKWSLLFFIVVLLLTLFKSLSSGNRHTLWLMLIYGLILVPLLSGFMPYTLLENLKPVSQRGEITKTINDLFFLQPISMEGYTVPDISITEPVQTMVHVHALGCNWSLIIVLIWIAGAFIASFRVIAGRIRLFAFHGYTDIPAIDTYRVQLAQMLEKMGIHKEVSLVSSSICQIPFTYSFLKPVVVFPIKSEKWSAGTVRSVLLHELSHIRRHDYLTQFIARIICSLFWYIPFVWIAYSKLRQEQEKACDVSVIERGIRPADYASHIISLASYSTRTVSFQGSYLAKGRKKFLEKRILHTLSLNKEKNALKGGRAMKRKNFILLCCIVLIAIVMVGSCATRRKAVSQEDFFEVYSGTWINMDYEYTGGTDNPQKLVRHPDGSYEDYALALHDQPRWYGKDTITDIWRDSKGDIWYRGSWAVDTFNAEGYFMGRISDSGNTCETILSSWGEPIEEWAPENIKYRYYIYYRQ